MKFEVIGLHPDNALKIALDIFDNKKSIDEKIKVLINNRPIKNLDSIDVPANFASGKTIDLNSGELLGIGCVASYYNWASEQADTNNTYQAVVGIEDPSKRQIENLLSDGAIWHDQARQKIIAQQVMAQGYYPRKPLTNSDAISAIKKKLEQRANYPDNCILIVNMFGDEISIDRKKIYDGIKHIGGAFTDVYLVIYNLPDLTLANVSYISQPNAPGLTIGLVRRERGDKWEFNYDGQ